MLMYEIWRPLYWDLVAKMMAQDDYRIVQFSKPSSSFDISRAGTLKISESQAKPYDECLKFHFHFCVRMYLNSPPPGAQAYFAQEIGRRETELGVYDEDGSLPEMGDPVWDSPLEREILRSVIARRCENLFSPWQRLYSRLTMTFKYQHEASHWIASCTNSDEWWTVLYSYPPCSWNTRKILSIYHHVAFRAYAGYGSDYLLSPYTVPVDTIVPMKYLDVQQLQIVGVGVGVGNLCS